MDIKKYEEYDVSGNYYNLKDKLWQHILKRSEQAFEEADKRRKKLRTKDELKTYCDEMRKRFIASMGGIPYDKKLPLNAKITGIIDEEYFKIEKVVFESRPHVYVTANLYIPKMRKEKCGAVLCQCGHAEEGKAYDRYQKSVREIASSGLIVLCMDPIGQGERLSYVENGFSEPFIAPCTHDHQYAGEQCILAGDTITRYFIADAMRAVDYLQSRPEVNPEKIGACGTSGGGTATCHLMICDERIKAAAPGTFLTNRREYIYSGNPQDSEQIWMGATEFGFDHHELLMSFAPNPLLILAVDSDFFAIEGTKEVFNMSKRFWKMHEKEDALSMYIDKSTHAFTDGLAIAAGQFFAKNLNGEERTYIKESVFTLPKETLNCTKSGFVKLEYTDAKFVYDENVERLNSYKDSYSKEKAKSYLREKVDYKRITCEFNMRRPLNRELIDGGYGISANMWFSQPKMPTYSLVFRNLKYKNEKMPAVICLFDSGTNSLENNIYKIRELCNQGKRVIVVDLAGVGKNMPNDLNLDYKSKNRHGVLDKLNKDLFFLGDSLCALRLFELEKAVCALSLEYETADISIYAEGKSAILARLYKLLHEETEVEVQSGESLYHLAHDKYYEDYNCSGYLLPGILKYIEI